MRGSAACEPVQELPHPFAAERHLDADELPVRRRNWAIDLLALVTIGLCPVIAGGLRAPRRAPWRWHRLAEADVHDDLATRAEPRSGCRIRTACAGPARPRPYSARAGGWSRLDLQLLTALAADADPTPVSRVAWPIRVGLPQLPHTTITLPIGIGWAISRMPPCWIFGIDRSTWPDWRGFVWRLAMLTPSTTSLDAAGRRAAAEHAAPPPGDASATDDALDGAALAGILAGQHDNGVPLADLGHLGGPGRRWYGRPSQHLRGERHDLHVVAVTQLARDRPEDACAARVALVVDEDYEVHVSTGLGAGRRRLVEVAGPGRPCTRHRRSRAPIVRAR